MTFAWPRLLRMRLSSRFLNWIEENGEHTIGEIMETDPEGIQNGRFNGMETIDKEIFQQLVLSTEGRQRWS